MNLSARIRQWARDLGFDLVGIAPAEPPACRDFLLDSTARGYTADLSWLDRSAARRGHPDAVLPGARSVVALGCSYFTTGPEPSLALDPLRGRIAAFAWGPDYHAVLTPRLEELGRFIEREKPGTGWRAHADTGPVLERHFAGRAGLGFVGRNTLLVHPRMGSLILLGVLLLDAELEYDAPSPGSCAGEAPHPCGRCGRCRQACPAGALPEPFRLDARRCISFLTIERRGAIPPELRPRMGRWIFGCDECQAVCPWVRRFSRPATRPFLQFEPDRWAPRLADLLDLDERAFRERYGGTPLERTGRTRLIRNALVALGNSGRAEARPLLERWTRAGDETLREHALWAQRRLEALDGTPLAQDNNALPLE